MDRRFSNKGNKRKPIDQAILNSVSRFSLEDLDARRSNLLSGNSEFNSPNPPVNSGLIASSSSQFVPSCLTSTLQNSQKSSWKEIHCKTFYANSFVKFIIIFFSFIGNCLIHSISRLIFVACIQLLLFQKLLLNLMDTPQECKHQKYSTWISQECLLFKYVLQTIHPILPVCVQNFKHLYIFSGLLLKCLSMDLFLFSSNPSSS